MRHSTHSTVYWLIETTLHERGPCKFISYSASHTICNSGWCTRLPGSPAQKAWCKMLVIDRASARLYQTIGLRAVLVSDTRQSTFCKLSTLVDQGISKSHLGWSRFSLWAPRLSLVPRRCLNFALVQIPPYRPVLLDCHRFPPASFAISGVSPQGRYHKTLLDLVCQQKRWQKHQFDIELPNDWYPSSHVKLRYYAFQGGPCC